MKYVVGKIYLGVCEATGVVVILAACIGMAFAHEQYGYLLTLLVGLPVVVSGLLIILAAQLGRAQFATAEGISEIVKIMRHNQRAGRVGDGMAASVSPGEVPSAIRVGGVSKADRAKL